MRIARVFARRTRATPIDDLAFYDKPGLFRPDVDEVHINVVFTWDIKRAEFMAKQWEGIAPVKIGGPGIGTRGENFMPGIYLKPGYVITSRGCPNRCWFCDVWKRDGDIRELPITDGWNVLDDNLLACSELHIRSVFDMLKRQTKRAEFTGGLESARLQDWHIEFLVNLRPKQIFFAYDTTDDFEHLIEISPKLRDAGFGRSHTLRCYVLIGYPGDTIEMANNRLKNVMSLGFMPMAMRWCDGNGRFFKDRSWNLLQWEWSRPRIMGAKIQWS